MHATHRSKRMAGLIRAEVAAMLLYDLKDPCIGFTTVTDVQLSRDLYHAKIFVSVLGSQQQQKDTLNGLSSAAGFVRREISHRLKLRTTPEFRFVLDRSSETSARIEQLIEKTKLERQPNSSLASEAEHRQDVADGMNNE